MSEKLQNDFAILNKGIKDLIIDNNMSPMAVFLSLMFISVDLCENVIEGIETSLQKKEVMEDSTDEDKKKISLLLDAAKELMPHIVKINTISINPEYKPGTADSETEDK